MVLGGRGTLAFEKLQTTQVELISLIERLNLEKQQQQTDFQALLREPERVKLTARNLGFYEGDEYVLFYENVTPIRSKKDYRLNRLDLSQNKQKEEDPSPLPLWIGVIFFMLTLFLRDVWTNAIKPRSDQKPIKESLDGAQTEW